VGHRIDEKYPRCFFVLHGIQSNPMEQ
jgi:hypothetical protein